MGRSTLKFSINCICVSFTVYALCLEWHKCTGRDLRSSWVWELRVALWHWMVGWPALRNDACPVPDPPALCVGFSIPSVAWWATLTSQSRFLPGGLFFPTLAQTLNASRAQQTFTQAQYFYLHSLAYPAQTSKSNPPPTHPTPPILGSLLAQLQGLPGI